MTLLPFFLHALMQEITVLILLTPSLFSQSAKASVSAVANTVKVPLFCSSSSTYDDWTNWNLDRWYQKSNVEKDLLLMIYFFLYFLCDYVKLDLLRCSPRVWEDYLIQILVFLLVILKLGKKSFGKNYWRSWNKFGPD